ncbi:MAG: hypothetical protein ACOC8F_03605, partial [Planctomycetota bacterium]
VLAELLDAGASGVAPMARLGLLATRDTAQLAPLRDLVTSGDAPGDMLATLLAQIRRDEIAAAAPLARALVRSDRDPALRAMAWDALAAVTDARDALVEAIAKSGSIRQKLNLLRILADCDDPAGHLRTLADGAGVAAAAARLEAARTSGGDVGAAALAAVKVHHAMLTEYVLLRAGEDAETPEPGARGRAYADALVHVVRAAPAEARRMVRDHRLAARAAALIVDLGDGDGLRALRGILDGRHTALQRAVAAGLLRSESEASCALARRIADSPYRELAADAALVLGRHGKPDAVEGLVRILTHPARHARPIRVLASWYLLKATGRSETAVQKLADELK